MKYLKCDHCGHPSPLKSEYLTFCEGCGKKLSQHYTAWVQSRPGATFEDFHEQVAIRIVPPKPTRWQRWRSRQQQPSGRRKLLIFFSLILILLATAGTLFGKRAVYTIFYPKVDKSVLYAQWHHVTIGRQQLEISTPAKLWVDDQPPAVGEAGLIEYSKSYRNGHNQGIQVNVAMNSYMPAAPNTLETAAGRAMSVLQNDPDISAIQSRQCAVLLAGMPGQLQEGSYLYKEGIRLGFMNLLLVRGPHRWEVNIRYREDDPTGEQVARRILKSVKIK